MSTLFISHSSADGDEAKRLQAALEKQRFDFFLDFDAEAGIQAGDSWERTLYTKLRACQAVVALASDTYLSSKWCFAEIALARMEGKQLFVLQIDPWGKDTEMPSILTEEQFIDLRSNALDEAAASEKREEGYRRLLNGFKKKGVVPDERPQDWRTGESPYPGLRAFDERDAPIFFGRDKEIREGVELLNRVRRQGHPRMVMVLGSSGSGKSSLARAGILPRLKRDKENWLVVGPFRPGPRPGRALAEALADAFRNAGEPRAWQDIQQRLGLTDEAPLTGNEAAAAPPADKEPSPRERLRAALAAMEGVLTTDADKQVARSVGLLKQYLAAAGDEPGAREASRPAGEDDNPLAALTAELRRARTDYWIRRLESEGLEEEELGSERELAQRAQDAKVVLLIDQFEELLGHEDEPDHPANPFLAVLRQGIEGDKKGTEGEDNPPLALGTMRSDFLGVLQRSGPLRGVGFKSLSVGPMSEDGMRDVIEKPAKLGLLVLEDGFTNRLVRDTGGGDALPLLAFTLRAMWDGFHERQRFDARGYEEIGELEGAIAKVADDILSHALETCEEDARKDTEKELRIAFLSLARPAAEGGGWARQPASLDKMGERVRPTIERFLKERLLVSGPDETVEVAHEALFRSWTTLKGWLEASREGLHLRGEIEDVAKKWQEEETPRGKRDYLLQGGRLARARALRERGVPQLSELAIAFIAASEEKERRDEEKKEAQRQAELEKERQLAAAHAATARRTRRFLMVVGALLLVAVGLFVAAREARKRADRARLVAEDRTRIAVARNWLDRDPTKAALALLEMVDPESTDDAAPLMAEALSRRLALLELRGHEKPTKSAAFSPGGDRIVTTSEDRTARLWNKDGSQVTSPGGEPVVLRHGEIVAHAAFDPSGQRLVTVSEDRTARVWSSDGTPFLRADGRGQLVLEHEGWVNQAAFDPSGERIVTGSDDKTARVWEAGGNGKLLVELQHPNQVNGVAFSPDGERIVTASTDWKVRVWSAAGGDESRRPLVVLPRLGDADGGGQQGHTLPVFKAVFDPTGTRIVSASEDDSALLWNADGSGEPVVLPHEDEVYDALFGPAGEVYTASKDGGIRRWNPDGSGPTLTLRLDEVARGIHLSDDGGRLVAALTDGTARVWSTAGSGEPVVVRKEGWVNGAVFCPGDGRLVVSALGEEFVAGKVWSVEVGRQPAVPPGPSSAAAAGDAEAAGVDLCAMGGGEALTLAHEAMTRVAVSPSGDRIVTVSDDPVARLWTGAAEPVLLQHDGNVYAAAFSHQGDRIVTASRDGTARLWNGDGTPLRRDGGGGDPVVLRHGGIVWDAAFDRSGERIVTAGSDGTARVWKDDGTPWTAGREDGKPVALGHDKAVYSAAFSPTGDRIVTGCEDFNAYVYGDDGSGPIRVLRGHDSRVRRVSFASGGDRVLTGSDDGTARVWNLAGGEPLILRARQASGPSAGIWSADFDSTGQRVVTTTDLDPQLMFEAPGANEARVWSVTYKILGARIRALTGVCLDPGFRHDSLREDRATAERRSARCVSCLPGFREHASTGDREGAFGAYRQCMLPALRE